MKINNTVKKAVYNRTTKEYDWSTTTITKIARKFVYCSDGQRYLKLNGYNVDSGEYHRPYVILDEKKYEERKEKEILINKINESISLKKLDKRSIKVLREINALLASEN